MFNNFFIQLSGNNKWQKQIIYLSAHNQIRIIDFGLYIDCENPFFLKLRLRIIQKLVLLILLFWLLDYKNSLRIR